MSELRSSTVLVVDDMADLLSLAQDALEEAGFEVIAAGSADKALGVLELKNGQNLAGLVTDVRLGSATTGWDVARRARELNPTLPIVYITGDSGHEWSAQGVPDSVLITKPFVFTQVIVALSNLLNKSDTD